MARARRGLQIAMLGPDGVGKSLLAQLLVERMASEFESVELVYMRPGLLPGRSVPGGPDGNTGPHDIPPYGPALSVLKLAYMLVDYTLGYWVRLWPRLRQGCLIVNDRYYLDVLADPLRYRYGGPLGLARLFARLVPGPDLYVVLDAPTSVIQQRSREMSDWQTAEQIEGYRHVARFDPRVVVLDATRAPDELLREVAALVTRDASPQGSQAA